MTDEAPALPTETPEAAKRRRRLAMLAGAGVAVVGFGLYALTHARETGAPTDPVSQLQTVSAAPVRPHPFVRTVQLSGEARPQRDIQVYAPTAGVRVMALLVDEGAVVRAGQPLARLDVQVAAAQEAAVAAQVAEARAAAVRAADELARAESIRDSGAISAEQLAARAAQNSAAVARLAAAEAQAAEVRARLQGGFVRAPEAGVVLSRRAVVGQLVDGQPLFRIAGGNAIEIAAEVAEMDILSLRPGQSAQFRMVDGTLVEARLRRLPAALDSGRRTGTALFDVPNSSAVRAGMFLRGQANLPPRDGLAVPQAAVLFRGGEAYVYLIDAEDKARRTVVQLGNRDGDLVEVIAGLSQGQRVIGAGAAFVQDGDKVRPLGDGPPPVGNTPPPGSRG